MLDTLSAHLGTENKTRLNVLVTRSCSYIQLDQSVYSQKVLSFSAHLDTENKTRLNVRVTRSCSYIQLDQSVYSQKVLDTFSAHLDTENKTRKCPLPSDTMDHIAKEPKECSEENQRIFLPGPCLDRSSSVTERGFWDSRGRRLLQYLKITGGSGLGRYGFYELGFSHCEVLI